MSGTKCLSFDFAKYVVSPTSDIILKTQGSEAKLYTGIFLNRKAVFKERFHKKYRHPDLDKKLAMGRMRSEVKALSVCREMGIKCPTVYFVDINSRTIIMEEIEDSITVKEFIQNGDQRCTNTVASIAPLASRIGKDIAIMHDNNMIHGDLTTSNMLLKNEQINGVMTGAEFDLYFIDFGLSQKGVTHEDKAVDLYVLEAAVSSSHPTIEGLFEAILNSYFGTLKINKEAVKHKFEEVRQRGRKRSMVG